MPIGFDWKRHTVVEANNLQFGAKGFTEATSVATGSFFCFKAVGGNATVSATSNFGDALSSVEIQNGDYVFGNFATITPTAGTVLCYHN